MPYLFSVMSLSLGSLEVLHMNISEALSVQFALSDLHFVHIESRGGLKTLNLALLCSTLHQ